MLVSFSAHEIEDAPETPGLYAWYGTIGAGRADWEEKIHNGEDIGERRSRVVLRSHAERHGGASLEVTARSGLMAEYSGVLEHRTHSEIAEVLGRPRADVEDGSPIDRTLESPRMRRVLMGILGGSTPVFSAPLYIGVSKNLRTRLRQHVEKLARLWASVSRDSEYLDTYARDEGATTSFALRAVERGFTMDNVRVWVMEVDAVDGGRALSPEEQRVVAEASEWMLNRCHRPILGRR